MTLNDTIGTQGSPVKKEIKRSIYKMYLIEARELYIASEPEKNTPFLGEKRRRKLILCALIICFALESYVNDFLFQAFPNDFTNRERDELKEKVKSLYKNKGDDFSIKSSFSTAIEMIQVRNTFAHYKPMFREEIEKEENYYNSLTHLKIAEYYKATITIMKEIAVIYTVKDSDEFEWIKDYSESIA